MVAARQAYAAKHKSELGDHLLLGMRNGKFFNQNIGINMLSSWPFADCHVFEVARAQEIHGLLLSSNSCHGHE